MGYGKIKETDIVNQIITYLKYQNIFCWRQGTGKIFLESKGKSRMFSSGISGLPDIIGILKSGRLLAIEVKTPARKNNLSPDQKEILGKFKKNNAVVFVATSLDDVIENLKREGI